MTLYVPRLTHNICGQISFWNGKPWKYVKTPKDYFRKLFYILVPYFQPFQILKLRKKYGGHIWAFVYKRPTFYQSQHLSQWLSQSWDWDLLWNLLRLSPWAQVKCSNNLSLRPGLDLSWNPPLETRRSLPIVSKNYKMCLVTSIIWLVE